MLFPEKIGTFADFYAGLDPGLASFKPLRYSSGTQRYSQNTTMLGAVVLGFRIFAAGHVMQSYYLVGFQMYLPVLSM